MKQEQLHQGMTTIANNIKPLPEAQKLPTLKKQLEDFMDSWPKNCPVREPS